MLIFIFMIVCSLAAVALAATIPSPFELNKVQQAAVSASLTSLQQMIPLILCRTVTPWAHGAK